MSVKHQESGNKKTLPESKLSDSQKVSSWIKDVLLDLQKGH